jgi:hypothetical protein
MKNGNGSGYPRARATRSLEELVDAVRDIGEKSATTPRDRAVPDYHSALKALELEAKLLGYLGIEGGKMDMDQLRRVLKLNGYELVAKGQS